MAAIKIFFTVVAVTLLIIETEKLSADDPFEKVLPGMVGVDGYVSVVLLIEYYLSIVTRCFYQQLKFEQNDPKLLVCLLYHVNSISILNMQMI